VARLAARHLHLRPGMRVALYRALPEELDTRPLISLCRALGCRLYFPRITDYRSARMRFFAAQAETTNGGDINRFGIVEPTAHCTSIAARALDLVLVPVVGFDARGARLGMGKGYYDRAFAFRRMRLHWHHPRLIGIAFEIQHVERIESTRHDVRLDGIVTEKEYRKCSTG
jgi:5-formyltetrahydrofolate cyclo-ligase